MSKFKILIPLDGTEKSMHSLDWLKKFYSKEDAEVTLINVVQVIYGEENLPLIYENLKRQSNDLLDEAESKLVGYNVCKLSIPGFASDVILSEASEGKYDLIIMTKSSVKGISRMIGSVTTKVVRNSEAAVLIVPE